MPNPEEIDQANGLVKAIIMDKWSKDDMAETIILKMSNRMFAELLKEAKAEGYLPKACSLFPNPREE